MATKVSEGQRFNKNQKKIGVFKSKYLLTAKVYMNDTYSD